MSLLGTSLVLLWLCATPYIAEGALHLLEAPFHTVDPKTRSADAIVVLGGGTYFNAQDYGGVDTISAPTLERLRYAAKLYRETGTPILVSGGKPLGNTTAEAQQMKATLVQEFNVPVQWSENNSTNTLENAHLSFQMLQPAKIKKIYLVTHAWHMARSISAFQAAGFEVVAAPTAFTTRFRNDLLSFIPCAESLNKSRIFAHEVIGLLWYRLKF
jgi:uncharacterized SAM-binding protein YcdF (DUF218 family)